jgi:hypothetical protein
MSVRAKFRLNSYTTELHTSYPEKDANGRPDYSKPLPCEKRTLNFTPVCSDRPDSENKQFWDATPSGSLQLGVVNPEAWKHFEIGKEYYLDFTLAE